MPQMRFMADTEDAVILGKRGQRVEKIFRRCVRPQFDALLRFPGTTQRFLDNIRGLPGPEIGTAEELRRCDPEPDKAFCRPFRFLDSFIGQGTRVIFPLPVLPINGNAMSEQYAIHSRGLGKKV